MKLVKLSTLAALFFALAAQSALAAQDPYEKSAQGQVSCQRRLAEIKRDETAAAAAPAAAEPRPAEPQGHAGGNGAQ